MPIRTIAGDLGLEEEDEVVKVKTISPFKEVDELEKEIKDFANRFKTTVVDQAKRISDYFEMCCFNYIVRFYELNGYAVKPQNLKAGAYKYKCSTMGNQSNFSHFLATKNVDGTLFEFEIQHNLAVQSSHDRELFTTPDISVVKKDSVSYRTDYYDSKRVFSFVSNEDVYSFCEAKQMNPFPELLFNFIGIVNELRHSIITNTFIESQSVHIAPSMMISGKPSKPTGRIKESLEKRYCINIIFDLFYTGTTTFSKKHVDKLRKAGSLSFVS